MTGSSRLRAFSSALLLLLVLAACAQPGERPSDLDGLFGLGPVESFTLQSEGLDRDFYIYVRLPRGYAERDCAWPVVYLLDGGILFPMLSPHQLMLEIDEQAPPLVMVGISYGGLGFRNGNLRSTDYTAPAAEPEYYGGASAYQAFLAEELLPRIEASYRVDPDSSLIVGQSLGGQFTLYSALTRPELFSAYLSINPALHRNLDFFLDLAPSDRDRPTPLLITRSSEESAPLAEPLESWLTDWPLRHPDALALQVESLPGQFHASSAPEAYRSAMAWWSPSTAGCAAD